MHCFETDPSSTNLKNRVEVHVANGSSQVVNASPRDQPCTGLGKETSGGHTECLNQATTETLAESGMRDHEDPPVMQRASSPTTPINTHTSPAGTSGDAALEGSHNGLWHSLYESQWNATLGSVVVLLLFVVLSVVMVAYMQQVEPGLENGAREFLASSHDSPFSLCPPLHDIEDFKDGSVGNLTEIMSGAKLACYPRGGKPMDNETWLMSSSLITKLAATASLQCDKVEAYCYSQEDLTKASKKGKKLTKNWFKDKYPHANATCTKFAHASRMTDFSLISEPADLIDISTFNKNSIFVVRLLDESYEGRLDYVLTVTDTNTTNHDFYWLLKCALDPILKTNVLGVMLNLEDMQNPLKVKECLTSNISTVELIVTREQTFPNVSCFKGVDTRFWEKYQTAYSLVKLRYRGLLGMTYDSLYACYTGLLGALIAGCVLCVGNIVYQVVLKIETPSPWCCWCAYCPTKPRTRIEFDGRPRLSRVSLPYTTKAH